MREEREGEWDDERKLFLFGDDIDVMWHNEKLIWYSKVQFKTFQTFQFEVTQWLKSVP